MPRFRPLPWLTVFSLMALALLLTLGSWQVQRMAWTGEMIAAYETRGPGPDFRTAPCAPSAGGFGPRIEAPAPILGETLAYYTLRDGPGWVRIGLMPAPACDGEGTGERLLLIETAFEPLTNGPRTVPSAWRLADWPEAGRFTSRNDPDTTQWYSFDREAMAARFGVEPQSLLPVWARSDSGLPASLAQTPPARHLGYAVTWYGLALALIGVYIALHTARGRLTWR